MIARLPALLIFLLLSACMHRGPAVSPAADTPPPIVLMIGLDGLRADALDDWDTPHLDALAARGVRAEHMVPVMPTKTFTNFYTLATGLYPEHHGMVSNAPYDRSLDTVFSNRAHSGDPRWWQGEPIWTLAERQGLTAHIMFWPGNEAPQDGIRPSVWHPYDHDLPYPDRIAEVLSWFDVPVDEQPAFGAVYFDHVDSVAHRHGPGSAEEGEAVALVDTLVGQIVEGLETRGVLHRTHIIVVSDHGVTAVSPDRVIRLDTLASLDGLFIPEFSGRYGAGLEPFVMAYGPPETARQVRDALNASDVPLTAYLPSDMPEAWQFNHPDRGPDLFILADPGWAVTLAATDVEGDAWMSGLSGNHGFDNRLPEMAAVLIAAGPAWPDGQVVEPVANTAVYGLAACLLGLEAPAHDGSPEDIARLSGGACPS
ncbi:alkaline phosphatase family protein [Maricaulis sp. CAU 1757]